MYDRCTDALTHTIEWRRIVTANFYRESAKIYQFPAGGRAAFGGRRHEAKAAADFTALRVANVALGSAWYHEAAVQDAERARKN
jgi:hypothetical protein